MYWTCELRGTTRVFDSAVACKIYARDQLSHDGVPPIHLEDLASDVHILYDADHIARIQPLRLRFAGNPNGQVILIAGGES